jgi:hypothetical protein
LLWGLELVANLYNALGISLEKAEAFAKSLHESNPKHITKEIVLRFIAKLRSKGKRLSA